MNAYYTNVRLYYLDPKGKKAVAAANTVIFDLSEAAVGDALARGYIREATVGEIAESAPSKVQKKERAAKKADADTKKTDEGDQAKPENADDLA